eukprot:COSAG06_NODE_3976_length_4696_cov_4.916371_4_plen_40_part_00
MAPHKKKKEEDGKYLILYDEGRECTLKVPDDKIKAKATH